MMHFEARVPFGVAPLFVPNQAALVRPSATPMPGVAPKPVLVSEPPRSTVLVVEDEPLIRILLSDLLEGAGIDVEEAADAEQALKRLEVAARRPELVPGPGDGREPRPRAWTGSRSPPRRGRASPGCRCSTSPAPRSASSRGGPRRGRGNACWASPSTPPSWWKPCNRWWRPRPPGTDPPGPAAGRPIHAAAAGQPSGGVPSSAIQSGRVTTDSRCSVVVSAAISGASPPSARAMT